MTVVAAVVTTLLAVGAGLALVRIVRGPSVLDRIVATDVLLAVIVMALATEAAFSRDASVLPVLAVLSILGFTGAVSVARFAIRHTVPASASSNPAPATSSPASASSNPGPASSTPASASLSPASASGSPASESPASGSSR